MTIIEICCGTAPPARAAAFLGLNSISFDSRGDQISTAICLDHLDAARFINVGDD